MYYQDSEATAQTLKPALDLAELLGTDAGLRPPPRVPVGNKCDVNFEAKCVQKHR